MNPQVFLDGALLGSKVHSHAVCRVWIQSCCSQIKFLISLNLCCKMEPACRKDKQKQQTPTRGDRSKQKSAQQELKQRQRAEIYALNKVMTELEQQQFEAFCKQMQSQAE
nr:small vasohibin-binding protein isoform X2 [Misgurnus anguillicaudatus]